MKITPYQSNKTNFTSISIVQIPKSAKGFKNAACLKDIEKTFRDKISEVIKPMKQSTLLMTLGIDRRVSRRPFSILEQPMYPAIMDEFLKVKYTNPSYINCDLDWFAKRAGISIRKPLKEDMYSFFVYTKDEKRETRDYICGKNFTDPVINAAISFNRLKQLMKANEILRTKFDKIAEGKPINIFVINDLSEMPDVIKKIDY